MHVGKLRLKQSSSADPEKGMEGIGKITST